MANIQYTKYEKGIDLQDHSSSYSSNAGAIFLSGTYVNFRSDLSLNSAGISNMSDPESAQDAATKAYVDAQVTAQDLDGAGDSGTFAVDLDSQSLTIEGTANEITTAASGQTLTISLPDDVTIGDSLTVTTNLSASGGTSTLAATTVTTLSGSGAANLKSLHCDSVNLDGGNIDGVTIGAASAAAGTFAALVGTTVSGSGAAQFTSLHCDSVNLDGGNIDGTVIGAASVAAGSFAAVVGTTGTYSAGITATTVSGSGAAQFTSLHCDSVNLDGGNIDGTVIGAASVAAGSFAAVIGTTGTYSSTLAANGGLTATTVSGSGAAQFTSLHCDSVNLDGGNIDGVTIGAASAAAGTFAALVGTTVSGSGAAQFTSLHCDSVNLDGGNIDGTIIGAASAAAGTFAALVGTSLSVSDGNITNVGVLEADTIQSDADAAGLNINFDGNTGTNKLSLADNLASALDITQGANSYIKFDSTDGAEALSFGTTPVVEFLSTGGSTGDADFSVSGYAQFAGIVEVDGALDCDSTSNFAGLMTLQAGAAVTGNVTMNGDLTLESDHDAKARSFITYSDSRLKTNVKTVTNAMDMIQGLRGVSYDLKSGGRREFGFIAQEVDTVVPEVVSKNGNLMGIDYTRITSLLVEAVKTQQAQIEDLKAKLDK